MVFSDCRQNQAARKKAAGGERRAGGGLPFLHTTHAKGLLQKTKNRIKASEPHRCRASSAPRTPAVAPSTARRFPRSLSPSTARRYGRRVCCAAWVFMQRRRGRSRTGRALRSLSCEFSRRKCEIWMKSAKRKAPGEEIILPGSPLLGRSKKTSASPSAQRRQMTLFGQNWRTLLLPCPSYFLSRRW